MDKEVLNKVSDRLNRLSESATIAMARKSRELKSQGVDVISLSLGEPDFFTPDFIKEAAFEPLWAACCGSVWNARQYGVVNALFSQGHVRAAGGHLSIEF